MESRKKLAVVLVTYNRAADLRITLTQLSTMQDEFDHLVVINNCSTDSTAAVLDELQANFSVGFSTQTLDQNRGGAGGFHAGVKFALNLSVDWIWLSDDDAMPQAGCLSTLLKYATTEDHVYGSTAIAKDSSSGELCWPAVLIDKAGKKVPTTAKKLSEMDDLQEVAMIPFLGFLVSRKRALEVGLPNDTYFISGDDVEYGIRMQAVGAKLYQVRDSVVRHPRIPRYLVRVLGRRMYCLRMDAWRRYFDVRNRIWNSRLRTGYAGAIATTGAMLLRLMFTLVYERNRMSQISAYVRGIRDGLFNFRKSDNHPAIPAKQH
jgi:rhamnopyranosyl-N-acetylglucosaminyl-diphospho-decaprenol beta-1,3/1,4-galactofuranosyltransferase